MMYCNTIGCSEIGWPWTWSHYMFTKLFRFSGRQPSFWTNKTRFLYEKLIRLVIFLQKAYQNVDLLLFWIIRILEESPNKRRLLFLFTRPQSPEQDEVASAIRFQGPCIGYGPISLVRLLMLMLLLMVTLGQCRSHQHLFPIRSLKSLPSDLSGLNRLGLVDAQRRDRIGPAEPLMNYANRITVVDHHLDSDSDIQSNDYILDKVGSVST
jgi:hypothetical protein